MTSTGSRSGVDRPARALVGQRAGEGCRHDRVLEERAGAVRVGVGVVEHHALAAPGREHVIADPRQRHRLARARGRARSAAARRRSARSPWPTSASSSVTERMTARPSGDGAVVVLEHRRAEARARARRRGRSRPRPSTRRCSSTSTSVCDDLLAVRADVLHGRGADGARDARHRLDAGESLGDRVRDEVVPVVPGLHAQPDEAGPGRRHPLDARRAHAHDGAVERLVADEEVRAAAEHEPSLAVGPRLAERVDEFVGGARRRSCGRACRRCAAWSAARAGSGVDVGHRLRRVATRTCALPSTVVLAVRHGQVDARGARRRPRRPSRRPCSSAPVSGSDDDGAGEAHAVLEDAAGVAEPRHDASRRRGPSSASRAPARRAARRRAATSSR